jgi:hypothetical protein
MDTELFDRHKARWREEDRKRVIERDDSRGNNDMVENTRETREGRINE